MVMSSIHDDHNLLLPQLPEEIIIFHILTKLPTKSLLRFSSVSKSWNSSISNPLFLALYRRHRSPNSLSHIIILISSSSTSHHLLSIPISSALHRNPSPPTLLLSFPDLPHSLSAKPANGLVLLHFPNHLYSDRPDIPAIILNPRTREVFPLPNNNDDDNDDDDKRKKVKVLYYFGYDVVDGVYKVLQIWRFIDVNLEMSSSSSDMSLGFKVLSLGCDCDCDEWRWIKPNLPLVCSSYNALFSSSCVSNGGIHWIIHRKNCVLAFDFHHEHFRLIPFPQPFNNNNKVDIEEEYLVEVGTTLGLLLKTSNFNKMEMWLLKDYHNQIWVKEQSFQYDMWDSKNACRLQPLGTVANEEGEHIFLFKPIGKNMDHQRGIRMLCYDMKRRRSHGVEIADLSPWLSSNDVIDYNFDVYEENIMSLSSIIT